MDVRWEDLQTILALVRHGSLQSAAAVLGINYTTVARRVTRAEDDFGQPLFERLASGYEANDEARLMAQYAERMEEESNALQRELAGQDNRMTGLLTITAPPLLVPTHLAPVMRSFTKRYPLVELFIRGSNQVLNLNRKEADLAIRISNSPDDNLVGRKLAKQEAGFFATPALDKKSSDTSATLPWLMHQSWGELPKECQRFRPHHRIAARFDDMVALIGAARAGLGVAKLPIFLGNSTPGLRRLTNSPALAYPDIWVVSHRDMKDAAKVRAFKDELFEFYAGRQHEFLT